MQVLEITLIEYFYLNLSHDCIKRKKNCVCLISINKMYCKWNYY